jgi:hypothetical protein
MGIKVAIGVAGISLGRKRPQFSGKPQHRLPIGIVNKGIGGVLKILNRIIKKDQGEE